MYELNATPENLIANWADGSGSYSAHLIDDSHLVTVSGGDPLGEVLTRAPQYDGPEFNGECFGHESLDGAHMGESVECDGSCNRFVVSEWMLTDRFGSCPDLGDYGAVWIDGKAYTVEYAEDAVVTHTTVPTLTPAV